MRFSVGAVATYTRGLGTPFSWDSYVSSSAMGFPLRLLDYEKRTLRLLDSL
jgi:hypothetical protein